MEQTRVDDDPNRLLRVADVARMANCSERTVWLHVSKGALIVVRQGPFRRVRVRLSEARRYAGLE